MGKDWWRGDHIVRSLDGIEQQICIEQVEQKQKNNRGEEQRGVEINIQRRIGQGDKRWDSCEVEGRRSETFEPIVCDSESRRKVQEDPELQRGQYSDVIITFQDRWYKGDNASLSIGRFRNQVRSRRSLSPFHGRRKTKQILRVKVLRARLSVQGPSIWLGSQPNNILQNVDSCNQSYSGISECETGCVHERSALARIRLKGFRRRYCESSADTRGFGMEGGKTQVPDDSWEEFRILGMELGDNEVGIKSSELEKEINENVDQKMDIAVDRRIKQEDQGGCFVAGELNFL
ncbi:MAG: hypothetical protein EZS28_040422 [Streblomastix strix]|uniref:Uncharacterized protein n=1 Tax=Streblomastix strix TaxID=222440 RepID=A0A5J4U225_9EUKA|nr:MAG: hypothetical protein EZS28_040422 [Streblomastix strix]